MASVLSADVDYLETVHPLDYPVFQSLLSNQFAKQRRLSTPRETFTSHDSPTKKQSGSELTQQDTGNSGSDKCVKTDSRDDGYFESGMIFTTSSENSDIQKKTECSNPRMKNRAVAAKSAKGSSGGSGVRRSARGRPSTSRPAEDLPSLPRTPATTQMVNRAMLPRKTPQWRKEKTVKFAGFRRALNPYRAVCGSFHEASQSKGLSKFMGSQCTSIGLTAIMVSKSLPVHTWIPADIDAILRAGDSLHESIMASLGRSPEDGKLGLDEIKSDSAVAYSIPAPNPHTEDWFNKSLVKLTMTLRRSMEYRGKVVSQCACSKFSESGVISMEDALCHVFDHGFDGALMTVGTTTGAVIRDLRGRVRYFDPHSNNKLGKPTRNGTAVLLRFPTLRLFTQFMKRKERNPLSRFEILGVTFKVQGRFTVGQQ